MKNIFIKIRNNIIGFFFRNIVKRIVFRIDPEKIHDHAIIVGQIFGSNIILKKITSFFFDFSDSMLRQKIHGIVFENPIGLAAGFDKNAKIIEIIPRIGFGFEEAGSITNEPCDGNPKPRLWRLLKSKSIVVNNGLNNDGAEVISQKLIKRKSSSKFGQISEIPIGISIAKTNSLETVDLERGIKDYINGIKYFLDIGDYLTINISCPNAYGGLPFTDSERLNLLLKEINKLNIKKPVFVKIPPDLPFDVVDEIIELGEKYNITGFICSNLSKNRNNPKIVAEDIKKVPEGVGGISGKPTEDMTNNLIAYVYKKTNGKKTIIGCGGISSAKDAYKKIKLGASLLQMITGMIFEGPQVISQINLGLCELLKKDGFKNISEAIGIDSK